MSVTSMLPSVLFRKSHIECAPTSLARLTHPDPGACPALCYQVSGMPCATLTRVRCARDDEPIRCPRSVAGWREKLARSALLTSNPLYPAARPPGNTLGSASGPSRRPRLTSTDRTTKRSAPNRKLCAAPSYRRFIDPLEFSTAVYLARGDALRSARPYGRLKTEVTSAWL